MVIKTIYIILFIFFVSCNTTNKNSTEKVNFSQETVTNIVNKKEDTLSKNDEVQKMLLSFYTEYIYTIDTISSNFSEIEQKN